MPRLQEEWDSAIPTTLRFAAVPSRRAELNPGAIRCAERSPDRPALPVVPAATLRETRRRDQKNDADKGQRIPRAHAEEEAVQQTRGGERARKSESTLMPTSVIA